MTDVLGKMQSMLTAIGSAMMVPAMELEDVSKQLGVMMGSSADASALASSLQRLATNGVVGMQELQDAAAALIGTFDAPGQIAQWVARFADISAFRNRSRLMDYIFQGRTLVAVKHGSRWALVPEDCSARVEILAKRHLLGR